MIKNYWDVYGIMIGFNELKWDLIALRFVSGVDGIAIRKLYRNSEI